MTGPWEKSGSFLPTRTATYFDGVTGAARAVSIEFAEKFGVRGVNILGDGIDEFWALGDIREIPDQADKTSAIFGLDGDHPSRLVVTGHTLARTLRDICPDLRRYRWDSGLKMRLARLFVGAVASVALIIWVLVPLMANQLATLLPPEGEKALGDATLQQIRDALGQDTQTGARISDCTDPAGNRALEVMRTRLEGVADLPYPITLHVLDHPMVNAFALPGGHIILFDGLLRSATSAEEVAGVLAHEMGHVAHRDPSRIALRSAGSIGVLGLLVGDFSGGAVVLMLSQQLIEASYTRDAEAAADAFAHQTMLAADLPPGALGTFFQRLLDEHGDQHGLVAHFASHPALAARLAAVNEAQAGASGVNRPLMAPDEWSALQGICGHGAGDQSAGEPSSANLAPLDGGAGKGELGAEVELNEAPPDPEVDDVAALANDQPVAEPATSDLSTLGNGTDKDPLGDESPSDAVPDEELD